MDTSKLADMVAPIRSMIYVNRGKPVSKQRVRNISNEELEWGIKVELEHTPYRSTAKKIAFQHLLADPNYYRKLKRAGLAEELEGMNMKKSVHPLFVLLKGAVHKYIRREGGPGNYKYWYRLPSGIETSVDKEEDIPAHSASIEGYWNGKIYGNDKYGYRIFIDNKEHKITKEQAAYLQSAPKKEISQKDNLKDILSGNLNGRNDVKVGEKEQITDLVTKKKIELTGRGIFWRLSFPYNPNLIDVMHDVDGIWIAEKKAWYIPDAGLEKTEKYLKKYFPNEEKADISVNTPIEEKKKEMHLYSGSGYGGQPYKVGSTLRNKEGMIVTVQKASKEYFREDGLSFGVGDDEGYIYSALVIPASKEEEEKFLAKEALKKDAREKKENRSNLRQSLSQLIMNDGQFPSGKNKPEGQVVDSTQNIYGGGDWFVVGPEWIWYVRDNGADGDNWANNNVQTGGAGGVGWKIPYSKEIADKVTSLKDEEMKKSKADNKSNDRRWELSDYIKGKGEQASEDAIISGEVYSDGRNRLGYGDWFVVSNKRIWWVSCYNPDETPGGNLLGQDAWCIPYDEAIANKIKALGATKMMATLKSIHPLFIMIKSKKEEVGSDGKPRKKKKKSHADKKMSKVMSEWGEGSLHSGSKKGPIVTSQKQALAIGYSEGKKK